MGTGEMVDLVQRMGVVDSRVLGAMRRVERAKFVPAEWKWGAYDDRPLPIGHEQTISQPYTVARMCELLVQDLGVRVQGSRVLEIGTGSGYQAAVLAQIFDEVYSVEVVPELAREAEARIRESGIRNVRTRIGDGKEGWEENAPYDAIIVAADANKVPPALVRQLAEDGRMVIPVRGEMMRGKMRDGEMGWESFGGFSFVPLI